MRAAGPFDAGGEGHRVGVDPVGGLPALPGVDAGVQVPAGVGGAGEADLVPRPGVGVERGAGVPGPQAPHLRGRVVVPPLAVRCARSCTAWTSAACSPGRSRANGAAVPMPSASWSRNRRVSRHACAVLGQVVVVPAVGLADGQPGVDQGEHRHPRLAVLGEQQVQQRLGDRPLVAG